MMKYLMLLLIIFYSTDIIAQVLNYRSFNTNKLSLNFSDSTYIYAEIYNLEQGGDMKYDFHSTGSFNLRNDTLTLISNMPPNDFLEYYIHNLTDNEIQKTGFSYIYPINEPVENGYIKIYFDNIAVPEKYKCYSFDNNTLHAVEIKQFQELKHDSIVKTEKGKVILFHYLLIKKPVGNKLVIFALDDYTTSNSYFFDLAKIPFNSFHFFTRVYDRFYDFTGLKFKITPNSLKRITENDDRYNYNIISKPFIKQ